MNRNHLALAAALSLAAFAAQADDMDLSGQYAAAVPASSTSRADVDQQLAQFKKTGVNTFAIGYNPVNYFKSQKTRAQVTAEFLDSRNMVDAMTAEDSGSAYLTAHQWSVDASRQFAGQPERNAQ
jgi:hypothetical protein